MGASGRQRPSQQNLSRSSDAASDTCRRLALPPKTALHPGCPPVQLPKPLCTSRSRRMRHHWQVHCSMASPCFAAASCLGLMSLGKGRRPSEKAGHTFDRRPEWSWEPAIAWRHSNLTFSVQCPGGEIQVHVALGVQDPFWEVPLGPP